MTTTPETPNQEAARFGGSGALAKHDLTIGQLVEVHIPGTTIVGQAIAGEISDRSTDRVLVLTRPGTAIVDRIPWSAVWLIRTRAEA